MTRAIEDELATAMREQVAGLAPAPDVVARAVRRNRRRARIRLGASVTAAVGITALAVAITLPGAPTDAARASRPLPISPRARLLAAMTTSAQLSYRVHLVNRSVLPGHRMTRTARPRDLINWYADYTGVYDPRTRSGSGVNIRRNESGTLADPATYGQPGGYDQVRVIGNRYYTRFSLTASFRPGSSWTAGLGSLAQALDLNGGRDWAPTSGGSADPAVLLDTVRRLGQVRLTGRNGSGAQALDTYQFRYQIAGDASVQPHQLAGTIVVHHQSNLIARITMQTTVTGAQPQIADGGQLTFQTVLAFSDYGVTVSARAPAAVGTTAG